jgi:hypothetical protein
MKGLFLRQSAHIVRFAFGQNVFNISTKKFGRCYLSTSGTVYQDALKEEASANTKIRSVLVANRGNT